MTDQPRDAVRHPPWNKDMGPEPRVTTWPHAQCPRMLVHVNGAWRRAIVAARYDWADGRVSYQLDVWRPSDDNPKRMAYNMDTYWWDPQAMRPLPPDEGVRPRRPASNQG